MNEQIFTVMEFSCRGDAMFGGGAADAQRRQLVKAHFRLLEVKR